MGISEDANAAADYIEAHGWCRNNLYDSDGQVCLRGAIYGGLGLFECQGNPWHHEDRAYAAEQAVREIIGQYVPYWNDNVAQSKEEVMQVLRDVATKHMPDEMRSNPDER